MNVRQRIGNRKRVVLLGIAGFLGARHTHYDVLDLGSPDAERTRELVGGQLQPPLQARTRWYQRDVDTAEHLANAGDLSLAAQLMAYAGRDGVLTGVLSTRTDGLEPCGAS
jgi:hypothetical protein